MNKSWILISLWSSIIGSLISFLLIGNWRISTIVAIVTFLIVIINNPKRRYLKIFWVLLSLILTLNKYSFSVYGEAFGVSLQVNATTASNLVTICLVILAVMALFLDFLLINTKFGIRFRKSKNIVKKVSGNHIKIKQNIND